MNQSNFTDNQYILTDSYLESRYVIIEWDKSCSLEPHGGHINFSSLKNSCQGPSDMETEKGNAISTKNKKGTLNTMMFKIENELWARES